MDSNDFRYSRVKKNQSLYTQISESDINNFDVNSNASIISDTANQMDIEKIKKILDTKYNDTPKRKSISIEEPVLSEKKIEEETKEYDINLILDKAKSEHSVSYEESRIKKPVESHLDILKKLEIPKESNEVIESSIDSENENNEETIDEENKLTEKDPLSVTDTDPKELLDLINTIVINENKINEENTSVALELFEDLVADSKEDEVKFEEEKPKKNSISVEKIDLMDEEEPEFMTKETKFKKSDFESLTDEDDKTNPLLKILIFVIICAFIAGMYVFLRTFLNI